MNKYQRVLLNAMHDIDEAISALASLSTVITDSEISLKIWNHIDALRDQFKELDDLHPKLNDLNKEQA